MNLQPGNPAHSPVLKTLLGKAIICLTLLALIAATGCRSSRPVNTNILYFQTDLDSLQRVVVKDDTIKNNDMLNIQIYSKSLIQDQAAIFNLPEKFASQGYTVRSDGNIEIPILGGVRAAGLTKLQLQNSIEQKLTNYIKSPAVFVKYAQFDINILGEVKTPGKHSFLTEKVTIIDALSAAGDLTDQGKREDITVIREDNQVRKIYKVDLRSGALFLSPVFQLQPNDLVYVGANIKKLRMLNTDPERANALQTTSIVISIISTLVFLGFTIFKK